MQTRMVVEVAVEDNGDSLSFTCQDCAHCVEITGRADDPQVLRQGLNKLRRTCPMESGYDYVLVDDSGERMSPPVSGVEV